MTKQKNFGFSFIIITRSTNIILSIPNTTYYLLSQLFGSQIDRTIIVAVCSGVHTGEVRNICPSLFLFFFFSYNL